MNNTFFITVYAAILIFTQGPVALAQSSTPEGIDTSSETTETPTDVAAASAVIHGFHAGLIDIMKRSEELGLQGRADALYPMLQNHMNVRALGIGAVGKRNWNSWEIQQQDQFIDVFTKFMASTYATRFKEFTGQEFLIVGNRAGPRSSVIIMTEVHSKQPEAVNIHYLLINRKNAWGIADIYLDGAVSEVAMRRSEFAGILRNDGFDALIDAVERKTADRLAD